MEKMTFDKRVHLCVMEGIKFVPPPHQHEKAMFVSSIFLSNHALAYTFAAKSVFLSLSG
jgi:hypothetical protein